METRAYLSRLMTLLLTLALVLSMIPAGRVSAQGPSTDIVISEFRVRGPNGGNDEFIELYNLSSEPVDISGWLVRGSSATGSTSTRATIPAGTVIEPGCFYLLTNANPTAGPYSGPVPGDLTYTTGIVDDGGIGLVFSDGTSIIDQVGLSDGSAYKEGIPLPSLGTSNLDRGYERKPGGQDGHGTDTDDNYEDFHLITPNNPQNSESPCIIPDEPTDPVGLGGADPAEVFLGEQTLLTVQVTPGTNPDSTGLAVSADLTSIGGTAGQYFFDDGTNGDQFADDLTFSFMATVDLGAVPGWKELLVTITDAEGRSAAATIGLTVLSSEPGSSVVISQVYGGGGNVGAPYTHDFIELFNRSTEPVSLEGWSVQYASATGTGNFGANAGMITELPPVILQPQQYYLIQEAGGVNGVPLPTPDLVDSSPISMAAGSGKVVLASRDYSLGCNGGSTPCSPEALADIVDLVGYGTANFFEGSGTAPTLSNSTAAFRKLGGFQDTDDNAADFEAGPPDPRNTSYVDQAPEVIATYPAHGAEDFPLDADITITFSEPVDVFEPWFSIECSLTGSRAAVTSGGPSFFTLSIDGEFIDQEVCSVTVHASQVEDQDLLDPPDNMEEDYTWSFTAVDVCTLDYTAVFEIQGDGMETPLEGQVVSTMGVVIGDYEGPSPALRGFYIQDLDGDDNHETSDGIFVFNGNTDAVSLGQLVRVTGTANEFQDQTQISSVTSIAVCGTGSIEPVDVTLPFSSLDYLERYEGMLVRLPQTLYVTEHFQLGRFGQVVMSSWDRLYQPTHLVPPGDPALALQADNDLNRIIIDDHLNNQNPDPILFGRFGEPLTAGNTLRGADTATGIVGVMTYTWAGNAASGNAYRVRPVEALGGGVPEFMPTNPRPEQPEPVGGSLKTAAFNVLNYFNTFGSNCTNGVGGTPTDCRGADNLAEFDRQWPKTIAAIVNMDVDVMGLIEIENDGYGADSAIQDLVDKLNAETAPGTYAIIDVDANTGQVNALGVDAIKVGLIYKPASVTPVGTTAALNTGAFGLIETSVGLTQRNRPALAQSFMQNSNGAVFTVVVNHLKSKGSACSDNISPIPPDPDLGDGQGNCNLTRLYAAVEMMDWLAGDPTGVADHDVLILGDLNSYAKEDPITAILEAGYTNLLESLIGPAAYSYVFDGQWGYLDYALASPSLLSQVVGVAEYHINSDEPSVLDYNVNFKSPEQIEYLYSDDQYRSSDHDPVIVGLELNSYDFDGFYPPIMNPPQYTKAKAGSTVPVRFSLGDDYGLDIFTDGYPLSQELLCGGTELGEIVAADAGANGLIYDPEENQYVFLWNTSKDWSGTCRQFVILFNDGVEKLAYFQFTK
jgi:uncharacterized protein